MFENFIEKLRDDKFITLETTPTASPTFDDILEKIESLELFKLVDGFSATDNPLAKLKYSAILASIKLQQRFDKPVLATVTMRDRNKLALQSDLLGANDFDIRAVLALTGDSAKISDQPNTKGVFEGSSIMLLKIIECFNAGINYAGRELKSEPKRIYPFVVTNSFAKNRKTLLNKLVKKLQAKAVGVITQPVFDVENAKYIIDIFNEAKELTDSDATLILGLFPITKLKTAQFLSAHVPGIFVPNEYVDSLYSANKISPEEEYKVGMQLSKTLFSDIEKLHPKIHLMTANRFDVAKEILI